MTLMRCFHLRSRQYSVPWAARTRIDETAVIDSTEVLDGVSKKEARVRHGAGRRGCRVAARGARAAAGGWMSGLGQSVAAPIRPRSPASLDGMGWSRSAPIGAFIVVLISGA